MELQKPAGEMKMRIETVLQICFPGLIFRLIHQETTRGQNAWDACEKNLRHHFDLKLGEFGRTLQEIMEHTRGSLVKLAAIHDKDFGYPRLVVLLPEKGGDKEGRGSCAAGGWYNKRALRELAYQVKGCFSKPMRLFFVCPYDFSLVPCGSDGAGYPLRVDKTWVKGIFPVLQVSRVYCQSRLTLSAERHVKAFVGRLRIDR